VSTTAVTPFHEKLVSVRQPRNTIPFAIQRNSIGGVPPSAVTVKVYTSPPRTTGSAVLGKSLARVTHVTSLVGGSGDVTCGASGDEPHERAQMQASGVEAYVILLMSTLMIHWMLLLVLRSLLIVLCLTLAGCGGEPSSPASPSSPSPTGPAPLVTLSTGTPSAELLVATNAPAATYRLSLEYILDNETDTHVVTTESPVTCRRWRSTPL